jgi:hypothetical protein
VSVAARAVLAEIRARGCGVQPEGANSIRIRGPVANLPPELIERARVAKAELIRLLTCVPPPPMATPTAAAWASYFARFPQELARLAAAAEREGLSARHYPAGTSTTAHHWAHWLAARGFGGES